MVLVDEPTSRRGTPTPRHAWIRGFDGTTLDIAFPDQASDDEVQEFCGVLETFWRNVDGPVATLFDCRRVTMATASQRRLFADLQTRLEPVFARKLAGAAFVINRPIVRGILTAIFWVRPPVYAHVVTATEEDARAWLARVRAGARR